jgi:predicted class III extradiol MEMO1 family dioxygenase
MATTRKRRRFVVVPHRGHAGKTVPDRWCVCLAETREVLLGPYHTEAAAQIVAAALNAAEQDRA